jgi:hypothetical protein
MSEQPYAELGKTLGILIERIEGLRQTMDARFNAVDRRFDDLRQHFDRRLDDAQKLNIWVRGLLVAIALLLAKIAFWP